MAETLHIKNFGPIKEAKIDVKDMMIFIGKQASGKSTLAKIITILNDFNFRQNDSTKLKNELEKYNLQSYLKKNTLITYESLYFRYHYSSEKETKFDYDSLLERLFAIKEKKKEKEKNELIKVVINLMITAIVLDGKQRILFRELGNDDSFGFHDNILEIFDKTKDNNKYIDEILSLFKLEDSLDSYKLLMSPVKKAFQYIRPLDSLYIPAERSLIPLLSPNIAGLINNDIKIPKHILTTIQEFEKAVQEIEDLNIDILGSFRFKRVNGSSYIYHNKTQRILLRESASGIQTLLPLVLLIEHSIQNINYLNLNYVVEEPELNLYPEAQYNLVKYLVKNCLETNRQVLSKNLIITTHSPYILASVNNLLLAHTKGKINAEKANTIIENCSWITPENFNAYEVKDGSVNKIFNSENNLIEETIIDEVTDFIMDDFRTLALIND
ncbi:ATP-binding protein [Maribacter algarum]|uniref:ATP-binding protein n=1 Tax=Maribacter algarum (ex Zhang et al. 2020) TaxID=2578118 RepID=A0A5S3PU49_9FLAO|nr:AAA family ATPase [Maribacter algarum]TMM58493.1 ATP-binding protein [Maribacter algarum]